MDISATLSLPQISFSAFISIFAAALGCGLLIGTERERNQQREKQPSFAGIRSFAICSLFGVICFLFSHLIGIVGALITGGIVIYSLKNQPADPGVTTELAFIMTYFIGALCIWNIPLAAGLAVTVTILLMTKHTMHGMASKWMTEREFRDGIFLLALILIALPLAPNKALWGVVLNPYLILKLLILILTVQALAHIAKRLLSNRRALILSALASGFVSSTATIANLGLEVHKGHATANNNAAAALLSCIATLVQLLIIVASINLAWLKLLLLPCLAASLILLVGALWLMRDNHSDNPSDPPPVQQLDSPMFSLKQAAVIATALATIQAGIYALDLLLGNTGLIVGTLLASLFEIHAAIAAVIVQGNPDQKILFYALLFGLAAHAISKCINAALTGGKEYLLRFAPIQILHMSVLIALLWLSISI